MSGTRLHHHRMGLIHTTVEGAFLTAGMLLSTVVTLLVVYVAIQFLAR